MSHPRDRHIQHQHRANANTHAIASTSTTIPQAPPALLQKHLEPAPPSPASTKKKVSSASGAASAAHKVTLDKLHSTKLDELHAAQARTNDLRTRLKHVRKEHRTLQAKPFHELNDYELRRLFAVETEAEQLQAKLDKLDKQEDVASYFMETGDILFQYYDNLHSIAKGGDARRKRSVGSIGGGGGGGTATDAHGGGAASSSNKTVVDFFQRQPPSTRKKQEDARAVAQQRAHDDASDTSDTSDASQAADTAANDASAEAAATTATTTEDATTNAPAPYQSRQVLLQQYLARTDPSYVSDSHNAGDLSDIDQCPECGTERVLMHHEAMLVCPACACSDVILVDSHKPSYKDAAREGASYYSYKRINHFNEWLAQFQAKETTDIPDDVYHNIYVELKKERVSNMAKITPAKMKEILKRLKLNKYYEHIPHITNRINGQPAPVMNRETEEKLRSMFKEIQGPFLKHCPPERKNFLSYSYVLHKFCQLLGLDHFLPCFPLLKSREKLHQQDTIWEKICGELQWEFIKSV